LRAYNAGPGAVEASKGFKETNTYVEKVTGNIEKLIPIAGSGGASLRDALGSGAADAAKLLTDLEAELDGLAETWGTGYGASRVYEEKLAQDQRASSSQAA
jgi:hypothetical protein